MLERKKTGSIIGSIVIDIIMINIIVKGKKQGRIKRVGKVKGLYPRAGSATGNRCSCDTGSFERVLPVNVRTGRANGASSLSSAGGRYRCIVPPVACELPLKRSV